ncbi:protein of unknown function [Candidatus Filomicrobium marinum]|uniref:Uncharacterized protein n=1 Tax=Candidatus Filomicrobium marinum TaxID=1608628 RepID=A0A0D6JC20_9HYPH|nr:hypothetical protein [Candidatus Filomicrobium marinum]CFX05201.1 protein of unknown function [Candidatus Filomicrobium marinum]CPR16195.1 protein of unknown function [Candidatus Filomicrobium marinum]
MPEPIGGRDGPFARLSNYEKKLLLSMVPSWSERYRIRKPHLNKQERETLLLTILLERRRLYERCFKSICANSNVEAPTVRDVLSEDRLRRYQPFMNAAIAATVDQRIHDDKADLSLRQAAENYRREKLGLPQPTPEQEEVVSQKRRERRHRMRM